MAASSRLSIILLVSCMVSSSVRAFESLSHNNNNINNIHAVYRHLTDTRCCTSSSLLYMTTTEHEPSDHHDREIVNNIIRNSDFDADFDFVPAVHYDNNLEDDFSLLFDKGFFDGNFPLLQEQADMLAFESFEEYNNNSFEHVEAKLRDSCGEECNECDIPKGWHDTSSSVDGINVMEFLGVKRVKPLTSVVSNVVLR
ncbi:MAG: hypothetical protein ACI8RD_001580 [Bacillariaceae sp.]|jgi:hypothetical protein